jgi:hypothetical protein
VKAGFPGCRPPCMSSYKMIINVMTQAKRGKRLI